MFRELRENELGFAVASYEEMLKELDSDDIQIIPTARTLNSVHEILKANYKNGIKSYVSLDNKIITAYAIFVSDALFFDTKDKAVYFFCLYVEPDYRNNGELGRFLNYVEHKLLEDGVKRVSINLLNRSIGRIARKYNLAIRKSLEKVFD